jgi:hypothetical protein
VVAEQRRWLSSERQRADSRDHTPYTAVDRFSRPSTEVVTYKETSSNSLPHKAKLDHFLSALGA